MAALLAGVLVVPAAVVTVASAEPAPSSSSAPSATAPAESAAVPDGLWDVAPPEGTTGDYVVVEGAEGDPVTRGEGMTLIGSGFGAAYDSYGGATFDALSVLASTGQSQTPAQRGVSIQLLGPGHSRIDTPGFHTELTSSRDDLTRTLLDLRFFEPVGAMCSQKPITGWVAIDHIRLLDGAIGELDLRVEQSCDGAPPLHAKVHMDRIDEAVYGPDPVPIGLWDVDAPEGSEGQNYLVVEGADDDPQSHGEDTSYIGDTWVVGGLIPEEPDELDLMVRTTEHGGWIGAWLNYEGRGLPEVGYYPVSFRLGDAASYPPAMMWMTHERRQCLTVDGWFAVDRIEQVGGQVLALDLRLEQSCDGHPPIHAKIHIDRLPPPTTSTSTTSTSTTSTTVPPTSSTTSTSTSTTSTTTAPPTTTTTTPTPPPLSRPPGPPFGSVDALRAVPGGVQVAGWVIDPDTAAPRTCTSTWMAGHGADADGSRPDVATAFSGYGPAHGFGATIPAGAGSAQRVRLRDQRGCRREQHVGVSDGERPGWFADRCAGRRSSGSAVDRGGGLGPGLRHLGFDPGARVRGREGHRGDRQRQPS